VTILRLFHLAQLRYVLVSYIITFHNILTISNITRTCWTTSIQWLPSTLHPEWMQDWLEFLQRRYQIIATQLKVMGHKNNHKYFV